MLAPVQTCTTTVTMSLNAPISPPKRPRLSLQIKTPGAAITLGKSSTAIKADIDPTSPTAFNTLSNAYAAAIEASSPRTTKPVDLGPKLTKRTSLRLETKSFTQDGYVHPSQRTQTPGPFSITYPDTPSSAFPSTTPTPLRLETGNNKAAASSFTFTPPQSAGPDRLAPQVFTFAANDGGKGSPSTPRTPRRRMTTSSYQVAPYTHPRSLHSILRNSPLPPRTSITPATPSRTSMRLANRAAKKVGYNNPLTQTITTNKYTKSHIDLLVEDAPYSATDVEGDKSTILDMTMAYTGNETRDGGQTPGPFEEMRRRMAESDLATPATRRKKNKDKKRKWEWTISSTEGETEDQMEPAGRTPTTALQLKGTPVTAIKRAVSVSDSEFSEAEERYAPSVSEDSEMSERDDWDGSSGSEGQVFSGDERPTTSQSL